jgi:hypothetical protein
VNFLLPNRGFGEGWGGVKNLQLLQELLYTAFYSDTAQQILTTVAESFKSFVGLLKGIKERAVTQRPTLPNYRQGGMALVTYTGRSVKPKNGLLK